MINKDNWDDTKKRYSAFWQGEIVDRCCISVTAPKTFSTPARYPSIEPIALEQN